jgi:hypothetical protein
MRGPVHLGWALGSLGIVCFAIWRMLSLLNALSGMRRVLMRNAMISAFAATISISFSGLMYAMWSGSSRGQLLLVLAVVGLAAFVASVAAAVRTTLRWTELPKEGTRPV